MKSTLSLRFHALPPKVSNGHDGKGLYLTFSCEFSFDFYLPYITLPYEDLKSNLIDFSQNNLLHGWIVYDVTLQVIIYRKFCS
jgi:hypothetical protein